MPFLKKNLDPKIPMMMRKNKLGIKNNSFHCLAKFSDLDLLFTFTCEPPVNIEHEY